MWLFKFCVRLVKLASFVLRDATFGVRKSNVPHCWCSFKQADHRLWCSAAGLLHSELHSCQHHLRQLLREDIKGLVRHTYAQKPLTIQGELARDLNPNPNTNHVLLTHSQGPVTLPVLPADNRTGIGTGKWVLDLREVSQKNWDELTFCGKSFSS